jgi:hypothetical protein
LNALEIVPQIAQNPEFIEDLQKSARDLMQHSKAKYEEEKEIDPEVIYASSI